MTQTSTQQILITGCYRSGTEYLTLLLNNQPDLITTMYVTNFLRFCYDQYNPIENKINYSRLVFDAAKRIQERWGRKLQVEKILDCCDKSEKVTYAFLYDLLMTDLFLFDSKTRWAEKTQLVWTKIPGFLDMFPDGKVIHVIRDPRSVLASFKKYTYVKEPAYLGAIFNCLDSMQKASEYHEMFPADRYCFIKYEDLMMSPENTLKQLFCFLNLSVDHDLLSHENWLDAHGEKWQHNSAFLPEGESEATFDKDASIYRWKNNLSIDDTSFCEEIVGRDLLARFGYELSDNPVDWKKSLTKVFQDEKILHYFKRWLLENQGVEEFPTDPILPKNWEENAK